MAKSIKTLGVPVAHMGQAVSDGELNMSARSCGGSNSSLPGTQHGHASQANSVLSWAASFQNLLQDPAGVRYFTAFLRSEVSAENILFWQACDEFQKIPASSVEQLKEEASTIYQTYLSDSAPYLVNIDDTARIEEAALECPTPDMFSKAQAQIFKLMKMDSYRRFVRSPLYQNCTLAYVEGRELPAIPSEPTSMGSWEDMSTWSPASSDGKKGGDSRGEGPSFGGKQHRRMGSWGELTFPHVTVTRQHSQVSVTSNSSVELGSFYRQIENGRSSPRSPEQGGGGGGLGMVGGGYCCVYLPDGSASLAPTRPGMTLRDMLAGLCEKRGFPLKDVIIYLQGKKQPLSLDQDCSVLRDQQVSLAVRVTFALEVVFTGKTVGIVAKSSKTLQDAMTFALQKHQLKPQDVRITMKGTNEPISMSTSVFLLANKTLQLDKVKDLAGSSPVAQGRSADPAGVESPSPGHVNRAKSQPKPRLMDMVSRAQCNRVDDQRGLLTKEQLELPTFLQLPPAEEPVQKVAGSDTSSSTNTSAASESSSTAGGTEDTGPKDAKETTL